MITMSHAFYTLVLHPFQFIKTHKDHTPSKLCFLSLIIVTMALFATDTAVIYEIGFSWVVAFFCILVTLFFQTIILDFIAQLFDYKAQSLRLFAWFGVTLLPLVLMLPLDMIEVANVFPFGMLWSVIYLSVIIFIMYLQVHVLKSVYSISLRRSVLLYFSPILFCTGTIILFWLITLLCLYLL